MFSTLMQRASCGAKASAEREVAAWGNRVRVKITAISGRKLGAGDRIYNTRARVQGLGFSYYIARVRVSLLCTEQLSQLRSCTGTNVRVYMCVRACLRACVRERVCVYVCVCVSIDCSGVSTHVYVCERAHDVHV